MTAEIVNLRRARKAKARARDEAAAAENRIRFGRTKEERRSVEALATLDKRRLEGHRLEGHSVTGIGLVTAASDDAASSAKPGGDSKPGEDAT